MPEPVNMLTAAGAVKLLWSHLQTPGWLKFLAVKNMPCMFVTLLVIHVEMSALKLEAR